MLVTAVHIAHTHSYRNWHLAVSCCCNPNLKSVALGQQSLGSSKETVVRGWGDGDPH